MSWVPAASGLYEPTTRSAPKPQAAISTFTFGKYEEKKQQQQQQGSPASAPTSLPGSPAARQGACYDDPVEKLRWWTGSGRPNATISTMRDGDIEKFWQDAKQDVQARVNDLCNRGAARVNKEVGLGSIRRSLMDAEPPAFAEVAKSSYKDDFCGVDKALAVGRRGVAHSPQAVEAFLSSKDQAQRNKSVGRGTNLTLAQFN